MLYQMTFASSPWRWSPARRRPHAILGVSVFAAGWLRLVYVAETTNDNAIAAAAPPRADAIFLMSPP